MFRNSILCEIQYRKEGKDLRRREGLDMKKRPISIFNSPLKRPVCQSFKRCLPERLIKHTGQIEPESDHPINEQMANGP